MDPTKVIIHVKDHFISLLWVRFYAELNRIALFDITLSFMFFAYANHTLLLMATL